MNKSEYLTKPRRLLKDFFNQHPDEKFTARQIVDGLGKKLSISSVYRNLDALEKQGLIKRFAGHGWEGIYYQFIATETCKHFLHINCKKCGKTVHVSQKVSNVIEKNLKEFENFALDKEATTIFGVCHNCLNQKGENYGTN